MSRSINLSQIYIRTNDNSLELFGAKILKLLKNLSQKDSMNVKQLEILLIFHVSLKLDPWLKMGRFTESIKSFQPS